MNLKKIITIKKKEISKSRRCSACAFYDKKSNKYGICTTNKSNKFIKFVHNKTKKAIIMVPRNGYCKFFKY